MRPRRDEHAQVHAVHDERDGGRGDDRGGIERLRAASARDAAQLPRTERRKELVKVVNKLAEDGRIGVRHARTEGRDKLKKLDKTSEDEVKSAEKELQKLHDEYIGKLDAMLKAKEAEIMEV